MARQLRFNISNPDLSGIGKLGIEGTNDEGVNADIYLSVSIQGTTVVAETLIASNIAPAAAYTNYDNAIPTDASTSLYMTGVYTVNIIAKDAGGTTVLATYTQVFSFNPYGDTRVQELTITNSIDCNEGFFVLTDATAYRDASDTTVVKTWTLTPPSIMGVPGATVTGNDDFVKTFFNYVNVTYDYYLRSDISYTITSGGNINVTETHTLTEDSTYFVECDVNLAEIKQCVYDTLSSIETSACKVGGFAKLDGAVKEKWLKLQQYLAGWNFAEAINDWDSRKAFYLKISALLGCECETDETVKAFVLPDGSQQVETAWTEVLTATQNGFVNSPTSPLHWRVSKDNRLQIFGKIQIPAGLASGTPYTITTGFIPAATVANIPENRTIINDAGGASQGSIYVENSTDLIFRAPATSTLTFAYVNIDIPLEL